MKKNLWMLGAAVAALTSCTQSEVVDIPESRLIGFEVHVDKQTRATSDIVDDDSETNGFKAFYVYAAKGKLEETDSENPNKFVFTADHGTGAPYLRNEPVWGGKGHWEYDHKSWLANKVFRFAAYANGKGTKEDNNAMLTNSSEVEFVVDDSSSDSYTTTEGNIYNKWGLNFKNYEVGEKDLIVAIPDQKQISDLNAAPSSVGLTFKHILAKVIIQFRYTKPAGASDDVYLEIEPITFNAVKKADCAARFTGVEANTTIGAEWASTGTIGEYVFFPKKVYEENQPERNQFWVSGNIQSDNYVIPQGNTNLKIDTIKIHTKNAQGETMNTRIYSNVSLKAGAASSWKPGYVYRYAADVVPDQHYIHFTTSVTSWIDDDTRNETIKDGTN